MRGPANKHMNARGLTRETRPSTHAHIRRPRHCLVLLTAGRTIYLACPRWPASGNIYRHLRQRTGCHRGLEQRARTPTDAFGYIFPTTETRCQNQLLNGQ